MLDYTYYNPSDESRSCVVRTMTKLTGKQYDTVKQELLRQAADCGCETYNDQTVFEAYLRRYGFTPCEIGENTKVSGLNLNSGSYCVYTTNRSGFYQLLPVIDGVIYDRRNDSAELYVIAVYHCDAAE